MSTDQTKFRSAGHWETTEKLGLFVALLRIATLLGMQAQNGQLLWFAKKILKCGKDDEAQFSACIREAPALEVRRATHEQNNTLMGFMAGMTMCLENILRIWKVDAPLSTRYRDKRWPNMEEIFKRLAPQQLAKVRLELVFPPREALSPEVLSVLDRLPEGTVRFEALEEPVDSASIAASGSGDAEAESRGEDIFEELGRLPLPPLDSDAPSSGFGLGGGVEGDAGTGALPATSGEGTVDAPLPTDLSADEAPKPPRTDPPPPADAEAEAAGSDEPRGAATPKQKKGRKWTVLAALACGLIGFGALGLAINSKPVKSPLVQHTTSHAPQGEKGKELEGEGKHNINIVSPATPTPAPAPREVRKGLAVDGRDFEQAVADVLGDPWFKEVLPNATAMTWAKARGLAGKQLPDKWATRAHEQVGAEEDYLSFLSFVAHLGVELHDYVPTRKHIYSWMLLRRLAIYRAGEGKPFQDMHVFDERDAEKLRHEILARKGIRAESFEQWKNGAHKEKYDRFVKLVAEYRKRALE